MEIETFWRWLISRQARGRTGLSLLISRWIFVDAAVAVTAVLLLKVDGFQFASKALFPAASILVSMSVAWTARGSSVINDKKFRDKILNDDRPLEDYVYGYQLSLLVIMITVVYISIMAVGGINVTFINEKTSILVSGFWLYFLLSMSVRSCWSVIDFSNMLGILNSRIDN
ncbi:hypothetical protein [Novosphingobium sp. PhB55]|uniref:hypothetical protein n=1 Tax=Novosphingobium sp. PhB55 TaxID=2485106 RepID=UPI001065F7F6|nr:hypothetical protein [Novosphingobium sp. PhB55]